MKGIRARRAGLARTGLAIGGAALLTGVSGCGLGGSADRTGDSSWGKGAGHQVSAMSALRVAEKSTSGADSAKVESQTSVGALMSMTAEGTLGWADGLTGTLTLTYTGGSMADTMRQTGSTSMEARYLSDAYYARMGDAFAAQTGGKHWIKYPYDALERLAGGSGAYLTDQMRNNTPNQSVKLLLASGDVRKVGEEKVRGADTTHYAGTVDVADLAARGSSLSESQLGDLKKQLEQAGVTTERVDIWVDDQDLLVKKVEKGQTTNGSYSQTAYYSDYGTPATAEVPPAADTADFSELLKGTGVGSAS